MTTSGTTAREFEISEVIEESYELAGVEIRSGYQLRSAIRSLDLLMIEWANRGFNLWTIEEASFSTVASTANYNTTAATVDVIQAVVVVDDNEYLLKKTSSFDYMSRVNKLLEGRPTTFWLQRNIALPVMFLWQVPDQVYTVKYWRMRRIQDAGVASNTMDIPYRFLPAMIAGLAHKLAAKTADQTGRVPFLEAEYAKQWQLAVEEDREKSSIHIRAASGLRLR